MHNRTLIVVSLLTLLAVTAIYPPLGIAANAAETPTVAGHAAERASSHWPLILAGIYCVGVVLASLAGGWLPLFIRMTHTRLQLSMSLCGGLMLGIGLLHLLPHAFAVLESLDRAVLWMMAGLLTMFFLIRAFHFHQHEPSPSQTASEPNPHEHHAARARPRSCTSSP